MSSRYGLRRHAAELAAGGALLAIAVAGMIGTREFPSDAARFPYLVLGAMALLSVGYLTVTVSVAVRHRNGSAAGQATSAEPGAPAEQGTSPAVGHETTSGRWELRPRARGVAVVVGAVLLTVSLDRLGFVVGAAALLIVLPILLGYRRLLVVVPVAAAIVAGLYYLFFDYLHLSDLPWTIW